MASRLPEDIKKRATEKCREYAYLHVQDPGTVIRIDGRVLVLVLDDKQRPLWLEVKVLA